MIEGLHRAGVEFRALAEDFDSSTATGKLQLAMVLAFSEWWRKLDQGALGRGAGEGADRGAFPWPEAEPDRAANGEYIRVERSRGVSQRELAKRLEVSRWTIQQVDG